MQDKITTKKQTIAPASQSQKPYFNKKGITVFNADILKIAVVPSTNRIFGLAQIDPSSLAFRLGVEKRAAGVYVLVNEDGEFRRQQRRKPKCEGYIPENSIDLIITSPPYNIDIHYNSYTDNLTYEKYLEFTRKWLKKCFALAKKQGRLLLNIPLDKNKNGQKSVGADITKIAKDIGWQYHATIVWNEGNISRRTAWGSYMSASAPYVIAPVELILVLYKDSWKKSGGTKKNDITKQEFINWTNGLWTFSGQNKKAVGGHVAAFPPELPKRCIKLFIPIAFWFSALLASSLAILMYDKYTPVARSSPPS